MANILIFGDSITYGCWDEKGGWAFRLKNEIENKIIASHFSLDHFIYPLGIPGDTSHTLLQRFKQEVEARIVTQEETILLFAIGINDSIYNNKTNSCVIPFWKYKNNLQMLLQASKRYTKNSICIGLTPVDESKVNPMSWLPECSYTNELIQQYDGGLQEICEQENIRFISVFQEWESMDYKNLLIDGIHPNSDGHKILFEIISKEIYPKINL